MMKWKASYSAGGNVNWLKHWGEKSVNISGNNTCVDPKTLPPHSWLYTPLQQVEGCLLHHCLGMRNWRTLRGKNKENAHKDPLGSIELQ